MKNRLPENNKKTQMSIPKKIILYAQRLNIYILVIGIVITSLLLLALLSYAGSKIYKNDAPEIYTAISGVFFLIILSLSGIVQILRREGPGPLGRPVFGAWPVITGIIIVVICWASIIYLLVHVYTLVQSHLL